MSFSQDIKLEIIENKPYRLRAKTAQAYGLFWCAQRFSPGGISLTTELRELTELYIWHLKSLLGRSAQAQVTEKTRRGRALYTVRPAPEHRAALLEQFGGEKLRLDLLPGETEADAFLSGAFLACGSMSDPKKAYHLELSLGSEAVAAELAALMARRIPPGPGVTPRRGGVVVYLKERERIVDLLAMMGAPKAALAVIDVEMIKEVRNRANRITNCETANIDKQVDAAAGQLADIRTVLELGGEELLSEALRGAARLRLQNPEASLRELCALSPEPVSRSGLFHRYAAISKLAEKLRAEKL